jgi:hypothetical protein
VGKGAGIAVFAEDAQPLDALFMVTGQQHQAQIAFSRPIDRLGFEAIEFIEGITEKFFGQLLGQHLRIEIKLLGTFIKRRPPGPGHLGRSLQGILGLGLGVDHNGRLS